MFYAPLSIVLLVLSILPVAATILLLRKSAAALCLASGRFSLGAARAVSIYLSVIGYQYISGSVAFVSDDVARIGFPATFFEDSPWLQSAVFDLPALWTDIGMLTVVVVAYGVYLASRAEQPGTRKLER